MRLRVHERAGAEKSSGGSTPFDCSAESSFRLEAFHHHDPFASVLDELGQNPSLRCLGLQVLLKRTARWRMGLHPIDSIIPPGICWIGCAATREEQKPQEGAPPFFGVFSYYV